MNDVVQGNVDSDSAGRVHKMELVTSHYVDTASLHPPTASSSSVSELNFDPVKVYRCMVDLLPAFRDRISRRVIEPLYADAVLGG